MGFKKHATIRRIGVNNLWAVDGALQYTSRNAGIYVVPDGFITDLASIPQMFWSLIGHPADAYLEAAILHDWLYSLERPENMTRKRADALFLEAMESLNIRWMKRQALYISVRVFGSSRYGRLE